MLIRLGRPLLLPLLHMRNRYFLLMDLLILALTPVLALWLRLDGIDAVMHLWQPLLIYTVLAGAVRLVIFYYLDLYGRYWRYASVGELAQVILAVLVSSVAVIILFFTARALGDGAPAFSLEKLPRSLPFIGSILIMLFVGGNRFLVRLADRAVRPKANGPVVRIAIMGAGDAGAMMARELKNNPQLGMDPVAFFDDDLGKHDVRIHNVPVLGSRHDIPEVVNDLKISQVIIAMPTAPGKIIREIVEICEQAGVQTKIIPGIYELLDGTVSVNQLRDVDIEDLLRRDSVQIDIGAVQDLVQGKRVLVTGGGGSIGSELCRQIWRCGPSELVILGHGENSVFDIDNEIRRLGIGKRGLGSRDQGSGMSNGNRTPIPTPQSPIAVLADIRFPDRVQQIFEEYRPQIVFHAAAHKHVPLMERNPAEAITNNVLGTRNLVAAALAADVERFVMISTDKAVNPTSIMGASKRAAELIVHSAARKTGKPFVAVRFGNVLGSRGSVVLTFKQQIAAGGPVTVTHPEMKRFFMTIPEAVQLVLQAAVLGGRPPAPLTLGGTVVDDLSPKLGPGGQVFVLDMGDPVKIADLAKDLIELSGLEVGRDIDIVFTGMRPGEKLFEELFIPGESYERTAHAKIFLAANASSFVPANLDESLGILEAAARRNDREAILWGLQTLIPEFTPVGTSVVGVGAE